MAQTYTKEKIDELIAGAGGTTVTPTTQYQQTQLQNVIIGSTGYHVLSKQQTPFSTTMTIEAHSYQRWTKTQGAGAFNKTDYNRAQIVFDLDTIGRFAQYGVFPVLGSVPMTGSSTWQICIVNPTSATVEITISGYLYGMY